MWNLIGSPTSGLNVLPYQFCPLSTEFTEKTMWWFQDFLKCVQLSCGNICDRWKDVIMFYHQNIKCQLNTTWNTISKKIIDAIRNNNQINFIDLSLSTAYIYHVKFIHESSHFLLFTTKFSKRNRKQEIEQAWHMYWDHINLKLWPLNKKTAVLQTHFPERNVF